MAVRSWDVMAEERVLDGRCGWPGCAEAMPRGQERCPSSLARLVRSAAQAPGGGGARRGEPGLQARVRGQATDAGGASGSALRGTAAL
ncbi:hypothetical protein QBZ16_005390 [Prototheca wickerhamii]|uniref:Uncharacterized protein n=1 Tax=Prototheca wickerhamii TaxID=3111 RepID=A0AAD9IG68_PROWI|nr:hypothetical protein QBZ16_005390 [Prototheca wickerhamii]